MIVERKETMKNLILIIVLAALLFICGCTSQEPMGVLQQSDCNNDAWAVAQIMDWPEPAIVGGVTLAATDVKIQVCSIDKKEILR